MRLRKSTAKLVLIFASAQLKLALYYAYRLGEPRNQQIIENEF